MADGDGAAASAAPSAQRSPLREFSSSEYARTIAGIVAGAPPAVDLAAEKRLIEALVALAGEGMLASAHDVSDGGLAVALAESLLRRATACLGADVASTSNEPAEARALRRTRRARRCLGCRETRLPACAACGTI